MILIYQILVFLLNALWWLIVIQAILSWLVAFNVLNLQSDGVRRVVLGLNKGLDPLYRPIRRILPDFGSLDLSPLVVLLILHLLTKIVLPYVFLGGLGSAV